MVTHQELVAEGNKLDSALGTIQRIVSDASSIPEQLAIVRANGIRKAARLSVITAAMAKDCDGCKHPKDRHTAGTAQCLAFNNSVRCLCQRWNVDV